MAWQELGGANTGLPNNQIDSAIHWLGTRDADPLIIRTENGPLGMNNAPNPAAEVMRITPATGLGREVRARSVGIGTTTPSQKLTLGSGNVLLPNANLGTDGNLFFGGTTDTGGPGGTGQLGMRLFGGTVNPGPNEIHAGFIDVKTDRPTDGLRIRVDTNVAGTERMRVTAQGDVGIGTTEPQATLHVNRSGDPYPSIHAGGSSAALSFASQAAQGFVPDGQDGNRWLWEAHPDGGATSNARLWSRGDRLIITAGVGQVLLPLINAHFSPDGSGVASDFTVDFPAVPIGTLPPNPPSPDSPSELVLGGVRTSIRGFLGPPQDPAAGAHSMRLGKHWIRTNGNEAERWMAFVRMFRPDLNPAPTLLQAEVPWVGPGFFIGSDERMKTNVRQVEGALDKLERIRGVTFEWAETALPDALGGVPGQPSIGVIAQEVEEVFPEVVSIYDPDQEYKAVDYDGLTSVLIEAVKELKAQNEVLRSRIEALEGA